MANKVSEEQEIALLMFRDKVGARNWKGDLRQCWESGKYPLFEDRDTQAYLQQVRNVLGPNGLERFRFSA